MKDLILDDLIQEARREAGRAKSRVLRTSRQVRQILDRVDTLIEGNRSLLLNELGELQGAGDSVDVAIGRLHEAESHLKGLEQLAASLSSKE